MHDWRELFPRKWIVAAVVALLVIAPLTWAVLTLGDTDPPAPELVAEVQGIPPTGGGTPCLNLALAELVAQNAIFSQEFRADVFDQTGETLDDAASSISDQAVAENVQALGDAFDSRAIRDAANAPFALDTVLSGQVTESAPGIDLDDIVVDVIEIC